MFETGFRCKKSGYFTKPVKNITNGIFICHKQVNNNTKSNSYNLKRQSNYFCNRTQLNNLKKYYEKLKNEADILKQIENTDPDKQLECLKQHYKKLLKTPHFLQSKKFAPVNNLELCKLEKNVQNDDDDAWDYLDDKEPEGPA